MIDAIGHENGAANESGVHGILDIGGGVGPGRVRSCRRRIVQSDVVNWFLHMHSESRADAGWKAFVESRERHREVTRIGPRVVGVRPVADHRAVTEIPLAGGGVAGDDRLQTQRESCCDVRVRRPDGD